MEETDDSELEEYILGQYMWERLPPHVRQVVAGGSGVANPGEGAEAWRERVVRFSLKRQLRWKSSLVRRMVPDERTYYVDMVKFCQQNLMLFPYHVSDVLVRGLRVSPFNYYCEMMLEVMKNELSYDRVPNFPAADCVRLLDVGRNEYIDFMHKSRQSGWLKSMSRTRSSILRELLPTAPRGDLPLNHWWVVQPGFINEEIRRLLDTDLLSTLAAVERGPLLAGLLDRSILRRLYARGVVYLEVPVEPEDKITVPPLENFVMNRVGGDYFENLLYKIFVSTDERTTVRQLSAVLGIPIESACQAISVYCRLGFAMKKNVEPLRGEGARKWHDSWLEPDDEAVLARTRQVPQELGEGWDSVHPAQATDQLPAKVALDSNMPQERTKLDQTVGSSRVDPPLGLEDSVQQRHIGFIFDYTLTALLMMGNLGQGLKKHAVTMYEVGKLADNNVDLLIAELARVPIVSEGEAQTYHDHAIALRHTLQFFRSVGLGDGKDGPASVDLLRMERLATLDKAVRSRMLRQHYDILVSVTPLAPEALLPVTTAVPRHFGPVLPEFASLWFRIFCYGRAGSGPASKVFPKGHRVNVLPAEFRSCETVWLCPWRKEPQTVSVGALVNHLNDALLETPVLVQARTYFDDEPEMIEVPFPLGPARPLSAAEIGSTFPIDRLADHPAVRRLECELRLDLCPGFVRMLRVDRSGAAGFDEWAPLEVCFGVPLFSVPLNEAVCAGARNARVFDSHNLRKYSRHTRRLSLQLLDFISHYCDHDSEVEWTKGSPLDTNIPSQCISFNGREMVLS